ncbi:hypothetical protein [Aeromicrobium choanae]|uniref:DUF2530 domain-containing protein n=1 Tax=Aeromicrobium choanae TaxID=1736691 RepID=A0A1T4Z209_9ACTN|nr:hypothetical protein [Aeromicrobium choanae]SKB08087.1 hypothetical protein SAMN06295964_1991 [Aeromicrobium choanae]
MARQKRSRIPDLGRPEVTELEFGRTTHRVAEVEPMDVDGVRTMTIGTIAWGVVALALLPFWGNLQDQGRTWWLWTAFAGLGLGLMGIEFCKRRRDALAERAATAPLQAVIPVDELPEETVTDTAPVEPQAAPGATTPDADPERPTGRRRRS